MPGYMIHLGVCNDIVRENRAFILGVEAPDILKTYLKKFGIAGVEEKYDVLRVDGMPNFSELKERVGQKESGENNLGLHYGFSSNPDIKTFWCNLSEEQRNNPFYKGYLWHLITDRLMYSKLDLETKFQDRISEYLGEDKSVIEKEELKKLHSDWDKTNYLIQEIYGVKLTPEVEELGVVGYINDNNLSYVDWDVVKGIIDELRNVNPLTCDLMMFLKEKNLVN